MLAPVKDHAVDAGSAGGRRESFADPGSYQTHDQNRAAGGSQSVSSDKKHPTRGGTVSGYMMGIDDVW